MPRKYKISPYIKKLQMMKAKITRYKKYGAYFSPKGFEKVRKNILKAHQKARKKMVW